MIDHVSFAVADYEASKAFYTAALAPLGLEMVIEIQSMYCGFGVGHETEFWVGKGAPLPPCVHVAFRAENRAQVDAFYAAAIEAGGTDNGKPGPRTMYHPNYYGAFVFDPDGHNVEAVCHTPE